MKSEGWQQLGTQPNLLRGNHHPQRRCAQAAGWGERRRGGRAAAKQAAAHDAVMCLCHNLL